MGKLLICNKKDECALRSCSHISPHKLTGSCVSISYCFGKEVKCVISVEKQKKEVANNG